MKRRGLLLDRDGVINEDHDYVGSIDRFDFKPGLFAFLRRAQEQGYRLVVVTNQAGVGRGYYTVEAYQELTAHMQESLAGYGIHLDLVLASFVHQDSKNPALARESFWRKPNPGMMLEAALRLNLDLARSVMVGDRESDMMAAQAAGVGSCYFLSGRPCAVPNVCIVPDFSAIEL